MSDPLPRYDVVPYTPISWPAGPVTSLAVRSEPLGIDMTALMEQRQTRRDFGETLPEDVLGEFLWLACRNRSSRPSVYGPDQESRPYPSAGAMHPIHVLVTRRDECWRRYDPVLHALVDIPNTAANAAAVTNSANQLVKIGQGLLVALVAEPGKTAAKYIDSESLVWRDAGVVLGYMSLVAEALKMAFCPLGITGSPQLSDLLDRKLGLRGVGLALLGAQAANSSTG